MLPRNNDTNTRPELSREREHFVSGSAKKRDTSMKDGEWPQVVFHKTFQIVNQIVRPSIIKEFQSCPTCNTLNDSVDLVCVKDNTILAGHNVPDGKRSIFINGVRLATALSVLAAGYANLVWPIFALLSVLLVAFLSAFFRNHRILMIYFLFVTLIAWGGYAFSSKLDTILLAVAALGSFFVIIYALCWDGVTHKQLCFPELLTKNMSSATLLWISGLMTVGFIGLVDLFVSYVLTWLHLGNVYHAQSGTIVHGLIAFSIGASGGTALVSAIVYSLRQVVSRDIVDQWEFRPILSKQKFEYIQVTDDLRKRSLVALLKRYFATITNGLIRSADTLYNHFGVQFVNSSVRIAIRTANLARRVFIRIVSYINCTVLRWWLILKWAMRWAIRALSQYSRVFIFPIVLSWLSVILLRFACIYFLEYIREGQLDIVLNIIGAMLAVTISSVIILTVLLRIAFYDTVSKFLDAVSAFAPGAFLLFLAMAWLFGIVGVFTGGPFRIGPITIGVTLLLVAVLAYSQRQRKSAAYQQK